MRRIGACLTLAMLLALTFLPAAAHAAVPAEDINPSVFRIIVSNENGAVVSQGSGFAIGDAQPVSLVVSNWHVVKDFPESISLYLSPGQVIPCSVYYSLPASDLVILRLEQPLERKPLTLGSRDMVHAGDVVYAFGFPGDDLSDADSQAAFEPSITTGVVSKSTVYQGINTYQIDAAINPGNSGGPLVNEAGVVIGVSTLMSTAAQGINGAVFIDYITEALARDEVAYLTPNPNTTPPPEASPEPSMTPPVTEPVSIESSDLPLYLLNIAGGLVLAGLVMIILFVVSLTISRRRRQRIAGPANADTPSAAAPRPPAKQPPQKRQQNTPTPGKAQQPVLRGLEGRFAGTVMKLSTAPVSIGREPKMCQVVFPKEETNISRKHCTVTYSAQTGLFALEDSSTNGTFLFDGTRADGGAPLTLKAGDRFYLCDKGTVFQVDME